MGQRVTKICDRCKQEIDDSAFDNAMALAWRGVEIKIVSHESRWGSPTYLVGWKGELCDRCHPIVVDTMVATFEKVMFGAPITCDPELPEAKVVHRRTKRKS